MKKLFFKGKREGKWHLFFGDGRGKGRWHQVFSKLSYRSSGSLDGRIYSWRVVMYL